MRLFNVQHAFKFVSIHAAHLSLCLGFEQAPERSWHVHIAKLPWRIARLRWISLTHGSHAYLHVMFDSDTYLLFNSFNVRTGRK